MTWQRAATVSKCQQQQSRWKHEIQAALLPRRAAMTLAVLPNTSAREECLLAGVIDRATIHWVRVPLPMEETMTRTNGQAPQYHMMTTRSLLPSPANRLQPSSSQTFDRCPRAPRGAVLEVLFEDHGVCSCTVTDSFVLEHLVYEQRALAQPLSTVLQL